MRERNRRSAALTASEVRLGDFPRERHYQNVPGRRLGRIQRANWRDAMEDARIVQEDRVTRIGEREASQRRALWIEYLGDAARNVVAANQHYKSSVHAVTMYAFGCGLALAVCGRFNPELMQFYMPGHGLVGGWNQRFESWR